uniref:Trk system potassium transporter TrkA n=1 Tax=Agathobacter sp. TaxID=2021311 RepID=UPI004056AB18
MFGLSEPTKQGLRILIVGCGKVGANLVAQLSREGHDITIIDKNTQKIQNLTNQYDVMGICGNGASYSTQKEAGIDDADLIIAVTESDELNLLCCTIAKQATECAAIARVRTPDYNDDVNYLREKLGLALIINPELESANEIARILYLPSALEVNSFAHGQAVMVTFKLPDGNVLNGMRLMDLSKKINHNILVCAVERGGEVVIPSGNFQLAAGDILSFVGRQRNCKKFLTSIGFNTRQVRDTIIIGGGKSAFYLGEKLLHNGINVKIIEQDIKRCEELSILLPKAVIINGDGTNEELLREEGIMETESLVPLTGIDEENIMLTLYAKQVSNAKVITKINRITFNNVINQLDLGSVVYPKFITSEAIIAYVRARQASKERNSIETLYHLFDGRVEAIEFIVNEDFPHLNVMFKDLTLKRNLLISLINRKGNAFIPGGLDCLKAGDTVMIVTTHTGFNELTDILA